MFVFPIEMCVWGGGALLIRYAVRRWQLGWLNMLLLALCLSIAEECLIQQTSLAPLVVQLKGVVYARAFGVNYVYLLWALVYETVFVVFVPVYLVELIYPNQSKELWVNKFGLVATIVFFFIGSVLAWFTWTQIARPNVFHLPAYNPPLEAILIACGAICGLSFAALGPFRNALACPSQPLKTPSPWLLGLAGTAWAILWFGLALLAFGIYPPFPPAAAIGAGLLLAIVVVLIVPRWTADFRFQHKHQFALIFGTILGSMLIGFLRFLGDASIDFYFKLVVNLIAIALMITLWFQIKKQSVITA
jgi:hypothetical protein